MFSQILKREIPLKEGVYLSLNPSMNKEELISVQRKSAKVEEYRIKFETEIDISVIAHNITEAKEKALELKKRDIIDQFVGSNSPLHIINIKHFQN